jgi:hypothetical protein
MAKSAIELKAAGEVTGPGEGTPVDVTELGSTLRLTLDVTDSSEAQGLTSCALTVRVETSEDGTDNWREMTPVRRHSSHMVLEQGFARGSHVHSERLCFVGADRFVRARWELVGLPDKSVTFSLSGDVI